VAYFRYDKSALLGIVHIIRVLHFVIEGLVAITWRATILNWYFSTIQTGNILCSYLANDMAVHQ
jgi:hypothetical protein